MIRPMSEIEYPPSAALRMKAAMIARMEALAQSSNEFMAVIAARVGAEEMERNSRLKQLSEEQNRLMADMRHLAKD